MKEKVRRLSKRLGIQKDEISQKGEVVDIPLFINGQMVLKDGEGAEEEAKEDKNPRKLDIRHADDDGADEGDTEQD